jgi:hypothetical protein
MTTKTGFVLFSMIGAHERLDARGLTEPEIEGLFVKWVQDVVYNSRLVGRTLDPSTSRWIYELDLIDPCKSDI